MDTINAKVLKIENYENRFLIALEYQIPESVASIRILNAAALGEDPVINFGSRQPGEPLKVIVTTLGAPALKVGDNLPIQVLYNGDVA
jgi:hypothetical protein